MAEATRRRLLRAGRRAFARRGLAGANLRDDILRPARVSVGSFYHQFGDKSELLLEILGVWSQGAQRARSEALAAPARSFEALAARSCGLVLALAEAEPDLWRIQARERWSEDARVRRFLRAERGAWLDALADAQGSLPGRRRALARRRRLAAYLLALASAGADARLEAGRRQEATRALARFAAAGAAAGGTGRASARRASR